MYYNEGYILYNIYKKQVYQDKKMYSSIQI